MKKYAIIIMLLVTMLTGCGNTSKVENMETTTTTESVETTTEADLDEMDKAVSEFPDDVTQYIDSYVSVDLDGTFTVSVDINDAGHMGLVADYITQAVDGLSETYNGYDILISYKADKWVCTWHSYDNKKGILINTLTNYTEENVTVDRLYEWNNK